VKTLKQKKQVKQNMLHYKQEYKAEMQAAAPSSTTNEKFIVW
jgi:hypothetical protein